MIAVLFNRFLQSFRDLHVAFFDEFLEQAVELVRDFLKLVDDLLAAFFRQAISKQPCAAFLLLLDCQLALAAGCTRLGCAGFLLGLLKTFFSSFSSAMWPSN